MIFGSHVRDPDDAPAARPLRVEDPGEEALAPVVARRRAATRSALGSRRRWRDWFGSRASAAVPSRGEERTRRSRRRLHSEVVARPRAAPRCPRARAEPWYVAMRASGAARRYEPMCPSPRISPHRYPRRYSARLAGRGEATDAHELVVEREVWPLQRALLGAGHVLPAAAGQEPVVAARDELGPSSSVDPVRRLDGRPVVEHPVSDVAAVAPSRDRAVDRVAGARVPPAAWSPVGHQDRRVATYAVRAGMSCILGTD